MKKDHKEQSVAWLEDLLADFQDAKSRGKKTNSNEERVRSIAEIKEVTEKLETYVRNDEELLKEITGIEIELAREVEWNDIVRPTHFEEDLRTEIEKLKK
jgi:hypothetical protein